MSKTEPWFVAERAEKQAALLWTELPVLVGYRRTDEAGLDLEVLIDGDKPKISRLGVEVKGTLDMSTILTRDRCIRSAVQKILLNRVIMYEFPVAVMVVDVKTTATDIGWLLAPSRDARGAAILNSVDCTQVVPATKSKLEKIAEEVREWHRVLPSKKRQGRLA